MATEFSALTQEELASLKSTHQGFDDPDNAAPNAGYSNLQSTNKAALGTLTHKLLVSAMKNISLDLEELPTSIYSYNQVRQSPCGHVQELDDTPGRERILIKHKSGAGIEIRPDGSIIINAKGNLNIVGDNDHKVIIKRDGEISYTGNYTMNVAGDYDLKVGGDYTVSVDGRKKEEIGKNYLEKILGNKESLIVGNAYEQTNGSRSNTHIGDYNLFVKGNQTNFVEGTVRLNSKGSLEMTSEANIIRTASNILDGAKTRANFIAPTGTIGGESFTTYTKNIFGTSGTFTEGFTAPTFHGSLQGNAATATEAGAAGTAGAIGGGGSAGTHTNTATNTTETAKPTTTLMTDYTSNSNFGIKEVNVDNGGIMASQIDDTQRMGGLANKQVGIEEIRAILKDPNAMRNETFLGNMVTLGKLNPDYINPTPEKIGRISNLATAPEYGTEPLGNAVEVRRFA